MVSYAAAISHGPSDLSYITGESVHKKHPEKIHFLCDHGLPPGLSASGIWEMMRLQCEGHPSIKKHVIQIMISPDPEHTRDFTMDDWHQLWLDYVKEFDRRVITGKNGKILAPQTNVAGSSYTVWLHQDSESGVYHIHADVCRVDLDGKTARDWKIDVRAREAAEQVAINRGWTTAAERHVENRAEVQEDVDYILRTMSEWSWEVYVSRLMARGYTVHERRDEEGELHGYSLVRDNRKYKASELGEGRHYMVSTIEDTWKRLHGKAPAEKVKSPVATPAETPAKTQKKPKKESQKTVEKPAEEVLRPLEKDHRDYTQWFENSHRKTIDVNGNIFERFIPIEIDDLIDNEIDYREILNHEPLTNLVRAYFTALMTPDNVGSGGGGTTSDMPWGRDPKEDEREFALRCIRVAKTKIKPVYKTGVKR